MRTSRVVRATDCQCRSRNATFLGSIPASSDTVEPEGRQMKQCGIQYIEKNFQIITLFFQYSVNGIRGQPLINIREQSLINIREQSWLISKNNRWLISENNRWWISENNRWLISENNRWLISENKCWWISENNRWLISKNNRWLISENKCWFISENNLKTKSCAANKAFWDEN